MTIQVSVQNQYWKLKGTIGDSPATLEIICQKIKVDNTQENFYSASYYYDSEQTPKTLSDWDGKSTGAELTFQAYELISPTDGPEINDNIESFSGNFNGKSYEGTWKKRGKELPFSFVLQKNDPWHLTYLGDSKTYTSKYKTTANFDVDLWVPEDKVARQKINEFIFDKTAQADFKQSIQNTYESFVNSYNEILQENADDLKDSDPSSMYNFSSGINLNPILNNERYLIYEVVYDDYEGGAHGVYASVFFTYQKDTQKQIKYQDIFKEDFDEQIAEIINTEVHEKHKIPKKVNLNAEGLDMFLVEKMPITDNIYPTGKGVVFHYNIYEVLPYAAGDYEIMVPYEKLKPYLKEDFKF